MRKLSSEPLSWQQRPLQRALERRGMKIQTGRWRGPRSFSTIVAAGVFLFSSVIAARAEDTVLRVGHFPNITHAQGLIAHALTRQGKGWFEQRLPGVTVQWYVYNAGPSAMEAMIAKSIDLTYVGPNPSLNVYAKSGGAEARVISGAAEGGSALVVQPDENLKN